MGYLDPIRDLSIKGTITLTTGVQRELTAAKIRSYTISEKNGVDGFALGTAESAFYELVMADPDHSYSALLLNGGWAELQIGVVENGEIVYSPFGRWKIEESEISRQSVVITLRGSDALAGSFDTAWTGSEVSYPCTLLAMLQKVCSIAGVELATTDFLNASVSVAKKPEFQEGATLRTVVGMIAACAGGFARVNRAGALEIVTYGGESKLTLTPAQYKTLTVGEGLPFTFNCLAVRGVGEEEYTRYAINPDRVDTATTAIQVTDNVLYTSGIATAVKNALTGFASDGLSVDWRGTPELKVGDAITVIEVNDGETFTSTITEQSIVFDGGLSIQTRCTLPAEETSSSGYVANEGMLTASGMLNGKRLSVESVTTEKLAAQAVTTEKLAAGSITAEKIETGAITAEKIAAEAITTDKIAANAITSVKIQAGVLDAVAIEAITARLQQIAAEELTTDELYAALAEIMELRVGEIDAGNINTDTLAAVLGDFVKLYSETAGFDFATIKDLQAGTTIIEKGVNGKLYVADLAVTEANMASLSVGELIVKGDDGRFYAISIDDDGNVTAALKQVGNDDVGDLSINAGEKLIEGSVTAKTLNAQEIFADSALIRELIAANLDVGTLFAREATIAQLNAIDISGNEFLRLMAQEEIRFEVDPLKSTVDAANTKADAANTTANTAQSTANAAQSTANAAQSTANAAQSKAEDANTTANAANTTANAAQSTANTAQSAADAAQSTADAAQSKANTAQSTANTAQSTANAAQSTADAAQSTADAAQQTADDANATAANVRRWMTFGEDGLKQGKSGSTYATLVDDSGFHILQKDEKISSFAKRQLAVEEVRVGKVDTTQTRCVLREAGDGGMIITVEGLT